jgi:hypothetical protein
MSFQFFLLGPFGHFHGLALEVARAQIGSKIKDLHLKNLEYTGKIE